jgi:hypothetical protein
MMGKTARVFGLVLLLLATGFSSVSAQSAAQKGEDEYYSQLGSLNRWTTDEVLRQKTGHRVPEFLKVSFGKHRGFDRMVFEADSDFIGYLVSYGEPPFRAEAGVETVKVRGKAFVEIALNPVTQSSDKNIQASEKRLAEQNRLGMPLIKEVRRVQWYEAELRYVVGLKRAAPFRVRVFSNPARLVVDFKH